MLKRAKSAWLSEASASRLGREPPCRAHLGVLRSQPESEPSRSDTRARLRPPGPRRLEISVSCGSETVVQLLGPRGRIR